MIARPRLPDSLNVLLRSQLEKAIYEAAFHRDDALIAQRYLVEKIPQVEIAVELGWDRSTVSSRLKVIIPRVEWAANRITSA